MASRKTGRRDPYAREVTDPNGPYTEKTHDDRKRYRRPTANSRWWEQPEYIDSGIPEESDPPSEE